METNSVVTGRKDEQQILKEKTRERWRNTVPPIRYHEPACTVRAEPSCFSGGSRRLKR
jgi:hypothetical protein